MIAPAHRTLEKNGITSIEGLAAFSKKELLQMHGIGKSSIPKLNGLFEDNELHLREN